jgi:outer membrane protein TolC
MSTKKFFTGLAAVVLIVLKLFIQTANAQDNVKTISLNDAVAVALSNNSNVKLALLDQNIAIANYKQTEAIFLPQVGFSYTAMSTNDPLNAFGFKLQQQSITAADFNPATLNHPSGTADVMTKLEVQQPLLNIDMLYMRKGAEKQTSVYQYKTQRTKEFITFEVQKAYLQLQLAYNAVTVLEEARQTAQTVYTFTNNHFKQGLIQKSDVLNAQVQLQDVETNLTKAHSNVVNASNYLALLMGNKDGVVYKITEDMPATLTGIDTTQKITPARADFMAMQKAIDASNLMIKSTQMSYLPKLNAFGNYQYNDSHLTGFGGNGYLVGVQLSWNLFNGNKTKNTISVQKLERDKLSEQLTQQKDQGQLELNKAYHDLVDARFEIAQKTTAVDQAAESLRILQNRYQQGLVNTTDVLMAETQLAQQKFALVQARYAYNLTTYYIQLLTSTTNK